MGVFPVSTGMNRVEDLYREFNLCVPRKHGDEPQRYFIAM